MIQAIPYPACMNAAQCRAARGLVNWSQDQLAKVSTVSVTTVRNFERGAISPTANNLAALRRALEGAGVIFVDENGQGAGVRLRKD